MGPSNKGIRLRESSATMEVEEPALASAHQSQRRFSHARSRRECWRMRNRPVVCGSHSLRMENRSASRSRSLRAPLLTSKSSCRVDRLDGGCALPLGIQVRVEVECAHTPFSPGDVLLVVTDGVTESTPFFGCADSKLIRLLVDSAPFGVHRVVDFVLDASHEDGAVPRDDTIVLAIQRTR